VQDRSRVGENTFMGYLAEVLEATAGLRAPCPNSTALTFHAGFQNPAYPSQALSFPFSRLPSTPRSTKGGVPDSETMVLFSAMDPMDHGPWCLCMIEVPHRSSCSPG
jgi:hypothetical protein